MERFTRQGQVPRGGTLAWTGPFPENGELVIYHSRSSAANLIFRQRIADCPVRPQSVLIDSESPMTERSRHVLFNLETRQQTFIHSRVLGRIVPGNNDHFHH